MPIFEYVCVSCGRRFEKLLKAGVTDNPDCPVCGSAEVNKQLSTFSAGASSSADCPSSGG